MKLSHLFLFGFLCLFAGISQTWSYPNFIGYGYTSCLTCHYNPYGNGPLTDYGRALGATVVADDMWYSKETTLDELGKKSGFLYSEPMNEWLRPSVNYRGLYFKRDLSSNVTESEIIHMDANVMMTLRLGPKENRDKFIATATFGYAPRPRNGNNQDVDTYRTREHYLGYRINENWGVYAGLMDKVYGIRIPDHIAYSRATTSNTMNDQTHGLLVHYTSPNMDVAFQPYVGNLAEEANVRQKGAAATFEYTVNNKLRPGASVQYGKSEFLKAYAYALHARAGFGKGNSVMAEIGQTNEEQIKRGTENQSRYWMVQTHLLAKKGLFVLNTIEYLKANLDQESKTLRWGPGIQYFIINGVELRADIYNSRIFSDQSVSDDVWDLTGQLHLWF